VNCEVAHDVLQLHLDVMFLQAFTAFPMGSVPVVLVQRVPAYSLQGQIEDLCMKFSCHHMKREEWKVSEEPGCKRWKNNFFICLHA
jgi:hypothetical protein